MSARTKKALAAALKHQLLQKPLDKITIRDITDDCGISRAAFYYHFRDIYDLIAWACNEDIRAALAGKRIYESWQEGLLQLFEAGYENKTLIENAYRSLERKQIERFLFKHTAALIGSVIEEKSGEFVLSEEEKHFIADFYTYSFVGLMLDWLERGLPDDYPLIVEKTGLVMQNSVARTLENFAAAE